jgi:hypothetical protein
MVYGTGTVLQLIVSQVERLSLFFYPTVYKRAVSTLLGIHVGQSRF